MARLIVLLIVAAAAFYLYRVVRGKLTGSKKSGCASGQCGCSKADN